MARARGTRTALAAKLVLVGALLFALLELTTRLYLFGVAGLSPARIDSVHALYHTGFTRPASDPEIAFELAPNVDGYFKLASFRTNSHGLRDREYPLEPPAGTFRIAVLGSSFSLGAGVEIEDVYHSVLERRLDEAFPGRRHEAVSFAVGAYDPGQVLATLESRALAYRPDLVLFATTRMAVGWLTGDSVLQVPEDRLRYAGHRTHPALQSFLLTFLALREADVARPLSRPPRFGWLEQAVIGTSAWWRGESTTPRPWHLRPPTSVAARHAVIPRLGALQERTGIPVVVTHLEFDASRFPPPETFRQAIRDAGLHWVDTQPAFRGTRASDFWIHPLDAHPDAAAHARFADVIARYLIEQHLVEH